MTSATPPSTKKVQKFKVGDRCKCISDEFYGLSGTIVYDELGDGGDMVLLEFHPLPSDWNGETGHDGGLTNGISTINGWWLYENNIQFDEPYTVDKILEKYTN